MAKIDPEFNLPRDDEHTTVVGRNGTGKTQLGVWLLSKQDLQAKPWYVLDYKRDELINSIDRARDIDYGDTPSEPGLYVLHSRPDHEAQTERWLWRIWEQEGAGLYIDEGMQLPEIRRGAYHALLTQGRSKRIPVITLTQRPVQIPRVAFSEISHCVVFDLNDRKDQQRIEEITPRGIMDIPTKPHHSRWYSVKKNKIWVMSPVPVANEIRDAVNAQLEPKRRWM